MCSSFSFFVFLNSSFSILYQPLIIGSQIHITHDQQKLPTIVEDVNGDVVWVGIWTMILLTMLSCGIKQRDNSLVGPARILKTGDTGDWCFILQKFLFIYLDRSGLPWQVYYYVNGYWKISHTFRVHRNPLSFVIIHKGRKSISANLEPRYPVYFPLRTKW